ncbi:MAG: hypothetical protein V2J24_23415 [Pseudomonadales bacterium]|jgi:5'-nucleotidase|nr:hypothetical protein [Pseudomonadales bacterium]
MSELPRERKRSLPGVRVVAPCLLVALLAACGGGKDGEFVTRTGIVITGVVDDGTPSSPVAGGICRLADLSGAVLDSSPTDADGAYLLLLEPDRQAFVVCSGPGQSALALRTFVSTAGLPQGGELSGQDVLPATTMLARIVAAEVADDPTLDAGARLDALAAALVPFDSGELPADADLQLLADAATIAYDALRDAGEDVDFDALLTDLYDDGRLDFFADLAATPEIETAVGERVAAVGRSLADAVLATHPAFEFALLNVGGARSSLADVDRFATVLAAARLALEDRATLTLSAGDTLGAGLTLVAGLETQDPFFDAVAVDALAIDAFAIGAEDLEFGPQVYGVFLDRIEGAGRAVITDIDPNFEPNAFVPEALVATTPVLLLDRRARRIGIVSAAPENLQEITATRALRTFEGDARIERIQSGIDGVRSIGARLVVLLASERDLSAIGTLLGALREVDLVVSLPGVPAVDTAFPGEGPRPLTLEILEDGDGRRIPVIPAVGDYAGLVEVALRADPLGELDAAATVAQIRRVATADEDVPTAADADVREAVSAPLATAVEALRSAPAGQSDVVLDPRPATLFSEGSNWGALVADAALFTARSQSASFATRPPVAALVDAGAMDSAVELSAGLFTRGDLFDLVDDGQLLTVLERITPTDLKRMLEFAFAARGGELFTQLGGMSVEFAPEGTAQVLDADGSVLVAGERIVLVRIGDTLIVQDGAVVEGAPVLSLAVSERVRDAFPIGETTLTNIGATLDQALDAYVRNTLRGTIPGDLYPVGGGGRIEIAEGS